MEPVWGGQLVFSGHQTTPVGDRLTQVVLKNLCGNSKPGFFSPNITTISSLLIPINKPIYMQLQHCWKKESRATKPWLAEASFLLYQALAYKIEQLLQ